LRRISRRSIQAKLPQLIQEGRTQCNGRRRSPNSNSASPSHATTSAAIEQAAAQSGAEDDRADRIAQQQEELDRLVKQRDQLLKK
jgi:hypothetical protein